MFFVLTDYGKKHRMQARRELEAVSSYSFAREAVCNFRAGRECPVELWSLDDIPGRCWKASPNPQ
jgi:hypothetical protein